MMPTMRCPLASHANAGRVDRVRVARRKVRANRMALVWTIRELVVFLGMGLFSRSAIRYYTPMNIF